MGRERESRGMAFISCSFELFMKGDFISSMFVSAVFVVII